jgi:hypothetical protein
MCPILTARLVERPALDANDVAPHGSCRWFASRCDVPVEEDEGWLKVVTLAVNRSGTFGLVVQVSDVDALAEALTSTVA